MVVNNLDAVLDAGHEKKPSLPDLTGLTRVELKVVITTLWDRPGGVGNEGRQEFEQFQQAAFFRWTCQEEMLLQEASGKQAGGQLGHEGATLKRVEQPTETMSHRLSMQRDRCHHLLPLQQMRVTEYRRVFDVLCCRYVPYTSTSLAPGWPKKAAGLAVRP